MAGRLGRPRGPIWAEDAVSTWPRAFRLLPGSSLVEVGQGPSVTWQGRFEVGQEDLAVELEPAG